MDASDQFPQDALAALTQYFVGDQTLQETMHRVASLSMRALPQFSHVGVTLMADDRPSTVVFSDEDVLEIDQAQYRSGSGPCLDAFRFGKPFVVDSTLEPGDWQEFRHAAADHGVLSSLSLPLRAPTQDQAVGALNLYARTERAVGPEDVELGLTFAGHAAYLLLNAEAYWEARTLSENLAKALESHATIDQAKGIIMATAGCTADEAMHLLIQQSQHQNIKLREVAAEIVANAARRRS